MFVSKTGRRLTQSTLNDYWGRVQARAGLEFDWYLATKHYAVHELYSLGLSVRAIAAQVGWSEKAVEKLLDTYGHRANVALAEVARLYESDATPTRWSAAPAP